MKASLGDRALYWGTIGSLILTGIGFTSWLTHVEYVAVSTAAAQDKSQTETASKFDALASKLDEVNQRLSRMEGKLDRGR